MRVGMGCIGGEHGDGDAGGLECRTIRAMLRAGHREIGRTERCGGNALGQTFGWKPHDGTGRTHGLRAFAALGESAGKRARQQRGNDAGER